MCARLRYWEEVRGGQRKGWSTKRVTHTSRGTGGRVWMERRIKDIEQDANMMLEEAERKKFRSLAATLNYMTLDRSDVQYAAKEKMHKNCESDTREVEEWRDDDDQRRSGRAEAEYYVTPTQPRRLRQEEGLGRPDMGN